MWIFSTIGFFSATQSDQPELLQIRARVRGDLDNLRTQYLPELTETIELPHRDYPYRGYCTREALAKAMGQIITDLTYKNFKNEVMAKQGLAREQLYAEVWQVMYGAEKKLAEKEKRNASRPAYNTSFDEFWDHYQGRNGDTREIPVVVEGSKPIPLGDDTELGVPAFVPKRERERTNRHVARRPSKPSKPTSKRR